MKIGVVIIFRNNENEIDTRFFIEKLNNTINMEFCFVNNSSKDKTRLVLRYIKNESNKDITILDIKKYISEQFAFRAGARYLLNFFDVEQISYLDINSFKNEYKTLKDSIKTNPINY